MARRSAERPAERGVRAETNAGAAYLTALKGGGPRPGPSVRRTECPAGYGESALSEASALKPIERRFGSSQGSLPSRSLLEEVQGW
jgi:hypothetical protein